MPCARRQLLPVGGQETLEAVVCHQNGREHIVLNCTRDEGQVRGQVVARGSALCRHVYQRPETRVQTTSRSIKRVCRSVCGPIRYIPHFLPPAASAAALRRCACSLRVQVGLRGTSTAVPPAASIFSRAALLNVSALTVSGNGMSPSPSTCKRQEAC